MPRISPRSVSAKPIRRLLSAALDFVYPPACPLCHRQAWAGSGICQECCNGFGPTSDLHCLRCCALVGPYVRTELGCMACRKEKFRFERAFALNEYSGPLRQAVLQGKHETSGGIMRSLTERLHTRWREELHSLQFDVVIPVPAHWTTRFLRSESPAHVIADQLARLLKVSCDSHILKKRRRTPPQASLSATQRRANLRDAFRVMRGVTLHGARILIADDVMTTGTTAQQVTRALQEAGSGPVHVAVIARASGL